MENGVISDGQISASSERSVNHAAFQGRLRFVATKIKAGAWVPLTDDANQWLQIDLRSMDIIVTRVAMQGRNGNLKQWVTKYNLQYGDDGANFQYYMEQGETEKKVY